MMIVPLEAGTQPALCSGCTPLLGRSSAQWGDSGVRFPHFCAGVKAERILLQKEGENHARCVQKTYTPEFKREAVRLAQTSGKPITQVARELSISDTSTHQW